MKTFFAGHPKNDMMKYLHKESPEKYLASLGKFGQKSFAPPKICLHLVQGMR